MVCPICKDGVFRRWTKTTALNLHVCQHCTLVALERDEAPAHFEAIEDEFFGEGYLRRQGPFAYRFLLNKARNRIDTIKKIKPTGKMLDLGCGTGELIQAAQEAGYDVTGLDYSKPMADYVSSKYNIHVYHGDPVNIAIKERFDIVVMAHVIEHVIDPDVMLRAVLNLLRPDGILYIATPNIDSLEANHAGWGSYEPYHYWYFNKRSIELLFRNTGFAPHRIFTSEPYSAWLNTFIRSLVPQQHAAARHAVHHDTEQKLRLPFIITMMVLNIGRFASGLLLTPLRKYQEHAGRGEELIAVATRPL